MSVDFFLWGPSPYTHHDFRNPNVMSMILFITHQLIRKVMPTFRVDGIYTHAIRRIFRLARVCFVVPKAGLEPARTHVRGILNPLRLPFRHLGNISLRILWHSWRQ